MFTGIVEDTATVQSIRSAPAGGGIQRYRFKPVELPRGELTLGESIAIDGCCLTVVAFDGATFDVEASPETLDKTTLGDRRIGATVNLERALAVGDRLGGHIVTGHVDCTGVYRKTTPTGDGAVVEIDFPATLAPYLVDKGSVTIDGVSLTVNTVTDGPAGEAGGVFTAFLIPHTLQMTTLGDRKAGDRVNLESDLLGKYVVRALALGIPATPKTSGGVSQDFLRAHGWV